MANPINSALEDYSNSRPPFVSTATVFDIADIFTAVHGYTPATLPQMPAAVVDTQVGNIPAIAKKTETIYGQPLYGQTDLLGYEVFCPVTIEADGVDYLFPYTVVSLRRGRVSVITPMTELNGELIELTGLKNFEISIKGFVIGAYEQFPDEGLKAINDVFLKGGKARLKSAYTDIFLHDNDAVVIMDMEIPAKPKVIGVRDFAMQLMSDNIFTLYQS